MQGEINNVVDLINRSKKMYAESETVIQDMNRKLVKQEEKSVAGIYAYCCHKSCHGNSPLCRFKKRQKGSKNSEEVSCDHGDRKAYM